VSHRSEPGSRSAGIVQQHIQIAQTLIADRLRAAEDYRLGQEARRAASRNDANEGRGFLARLVRGKRGRSPQPSAERVPLVLPTIAGGQARESEGQS
jgi:hypothetical protein